jgi:hypothetical protein
MKRAVPSSLAPAWLIVSVRPTSTVKSGGANAWRGLPGWSSGALHAISFAAAAARGRSAAG